MSRDGRKPWEIPISYNDDRWVEPKRAEGVAENPVSRGASDNGDERDAGDIETILRRPDRVHEDREYECNDVTPINYGKGPHDEELGVDDHDFDEPDTVPVDYDRGPHEDEFGVDDDDSFEPVGDEAEFPDI